MGTILAVVGIGLVAVGYVVYQFRSGRKVTITPMVQRIETPLADSQEAPTVPGWYADPTMRDTLRYWDGSAWTENVAPITNSGQAVSRDSQAGLVAFLILGASVVGTIMAMQSGSLLTGTGTQWTGFAIAAVAGAGSYAVRHSIPFWIRLIAILAVGLSLASVLYLEDQLDQKREDISNIYP